MKPTPDTFEAWNEQMSQKYNPDQYHNSKNLLLRFIEGTRTRVILRSLAIKPTDKVLDIGCGAGNMLEKINAVRTGIDLSDTMILRSKQKLGHSVELNKMSADKLEFADNTFDKIICSEVIEHVLEPRKVLIEIARVIKPGGLAAVSIPNEKLIEWTKYLLKKYGFKILMKNDGETNLDDVENEWHLHQGSKEVFLNWNEGLLPIVGTYRIPCRLVPFRYVFLLKKDGH